MFYLLHGDDEFTIREQAKAIRQQGNFEFNQDTFYGNEVDLAALGAACNTLPFLTDQRLVVLEGLPRRRRGEAPSDESNTDSPGQPARDTRDSKAKKGKKSGKNAGSRASIEKALAECAAQMPDSTVLVVLVDEVLESKNALFKAAEQHGKVIQCTQPRGRALESWIAKRARSIGVGIELDAATMLANFIGSELRLLANELDKLATYAGPGQTITVDTVRLLTAHVQEARIFDLTDALAQRNRKQALDILHDLLADGEPPLKLLSTITSQVRSLLLIKELAQKGMRSGQISSTLGMAPFVVDKGLKQVGRFTSMQLEGAYRQLLATDAALKRSRMTPEMALDLLIVGFGETFVSS